MNQRNEQMRNSNRNRGRAQHVTNWNDPAFDEFSDQYDSRMDRENARAFESSDRGYNEYQGRSFTRIPRRDPGLDDRFADEQYSRRFGGRNEYYRGGLDRESDYQNYDLGTGTSMRDRENRSSFFSEQNSRLNDRGHYGKGPKGYQRSDDRIKEDACEALQDNRFVDASAIEVDVKEGVVSLRGTVETREAKREAERCVENVRGVTDVRNEIQLQRKDLASSKSTLGSTGGLS